MKTGLELVQQIEAAWTECRKYNGALAVEALKQALADEAITASGRDSYIRSLNIEWDLLVLNDGAKPAFNLLEAARAAGVKCCYVSFCDRQKAAAKTEILGFPCFNLTWSHGSTKPREDSGEWPMLVSFLRA